MTHTFGARLAQLMAAAWLLLFLVPCGCDSPSTSTGEDHSETTAENSDGKTANDIWTRTLRAYRDADAYGDRGVLYLSYQLDGQYVEEQQPWRTDWQRQADSDTASIAADWYNTEIRSSDGITRCYVYDIETGNLDQQCLVVAGDARKGVERVLNDAIGRHYSAGYSEIPLREGPDGLVGNLIPPVFGWLSGAENWDMLDRANITRLKDGLVDGKPCYHLKFENARGICELWIDRATDVVRQMTIPASFLHPGVTSSEDVAEIQFFARFHEATFQPRMDTATFEISLPTQAVPVQQFVALPDEFPCRSIGKRLTGLRIFDSHGDALPINRLMDTTSLLLWLDGLSGVQALQRIEQLAAHSEGLQDVSIYAIFSESLMDGESTEYPRVNGSLPQKAEAVGLKVEWLYDQQSMGAEEIGLIHLPAAMVIAPTALMEYAKPIASDGWVDDALAAISRTVRGEHLSAEMVEDYQSHVDRYKRKLQLVSATRLIGRATPANPDTAAVESVPARKLWENQELARPGNLYFVPETESDGIRLFAFDGWQTLCELDLNGKLLNRTELDLPAGSGVSCLRWSRGSGRQFAAFSPFARSLHLFDDGLQAVATIQSSTRDSMLDCQWAQIADEPRWIVAFENEGVITYDRDGQERERLSPEKLDSLQVAGTMLYGVRNGELVSFDLDSSSPELHVIPCPETLVRLVRLEVETNQVPPAVAVDGASTWQLMTWDETGKRWDRHLIGSQMFESMIEPNVGTGSQSEKWLASADTFGNLFIAQAAGKVVGQFPAGDGLSGLELASGHDGVFIVTSTPGGVVAWVLD